MRSFILRLLLLIFCIAIADFLWIRFMPMKYHIPYVWFILAFFAAGTFLFHSLTMRAAKGKPQAFVRHYMGSTALRMFLCIVIIVIYRFRDENSVVPFALGFMTHYFLFTAFEVLALLREFKNG